MNKKQEFRNMLCLRLHDRGWRNMTHFTNDSGVPYTIETVRKVFVDVPGKVVGPATLAVILRHLDYTLGEIKALLKEYSDDRDICHLLSDSHYTLSTDEEMVLGVYNKVINVDDMFRSKIADVLSLVAMSAGVDVTVEVKQLQRQRPKS